MSKLIKCVLYVIIIKCNSIFLNSISAVLRSLAGDQRGINRYISISRIPDLYQGIVASFSGTSFLDRFFVPQVRIMKYFTVYP